MSDDVLCNLCGLSCLVPGAISEPSGLLKARVCGGYDSTPGNGAGALDDTVAYTFSMCEFCLDWLFARFKIPVVTTDYTNSDASEEPWRPAVERVRNDDWRKMKDKFFAEHVRRAAARQAKFLARILP
jgi:hypothetical protein